MLECLHAHIRNEKNSNGVVNWVVKLYSVPLLLVPNNVSIQSHALEVHFVFQYGLYY
jgi:hypothetical protein